VSTFPGVGTGRVMSAKTAQRALWTALVPHVGKPVWEVPVPSPLASARNVVAMGVAEAAAPVMSYLAARMGPACMCRGVEMALVIRENPVAIARQTAGSVAGTHAHYRRNANRGSAWTTSAATRSVVVSAGDAMCLAWRGSVRSMEVSQIRTWNAVSAGYVTERATALWYRRDMTTWTNVICKRSPPVVGQASAMVLEPVLNTVKTRSVLRGRVSTIPTSRHVPVTAMACAGSRYPFPAIHIFVRVRSVAPPVDQTRTA